MRTMHMRRGGRGAMAGWLLVGATMVSVCQATPLAPEATSARDAVHLEGTLSNDLDRRLVGEVAQEVLRTGSGVTPSGLGIDNAFLDTRSLAHDEQLRERLRDDTSNRMAWPGRPNTVRNGDASAPDIFRDALNSALRATQDAFFEGGDAAFFSVAGMDLTVMLKGDRRGVTINGYELLASNQYGGQGSDGFVRAAAETETTIGRARPELTVRQYADDSSDQRLFAEIRRFFSDPINLGAILVILGVWVVFSMASSRARG